MRPALVRILRSARKETLKVDPIIARLGTFNGESSCGIRTKKGAVFANLNRSNIDIMLYIFNKENRCPLFEQIHIYQ